MKVQKISKSATAGIGVVLWVIVIIALLFGGALYQNQVAAQSATGSELPPGHLLARLKGVQEGEATDAAARSFRAGRDLIEEAKWNEAAKSFTSFIGNYPRHRSIDAAFYWLAFALKKQGKLNEADQTLARLIKEHPKSSWKDDAQAMRVEMAPQLGNHAAINQALEESDEKSADELKIVALQSLVFSNSERALPMIQDLLKPDAKASRSVKQSAVGFLGQMGGGRGVDTLIDVARNHKEIELRQTAIFWLGQSGEDRAFELLKEIVVAGNEKKELLDSALFAISQSRNPRARAYLLELARTAPSPDVRRAAIFNLGVRGGDAAVDELLAIYETEADPELKKHALFVLGMGGGQRAQAKLLEVARADQNVELRKTAVFWLGQRGNEESLAQLIQLFDSESNNDVKEHLLMVMSQSRSKTALRKLMEIARTSQSVELRKRAVFWLGQSKDPEAKKFIEDILK